MERFQIVDLESGAMDEIVLCDQTYSVDGDERDDERQRDFGAVDVYPAWDGVPLYDAVEWNVYRGHQVSVLQAEHKVASWRIQFR